MSEEYSPASIDAQAIVAEQQVNAATDYNSRSRMLLGAVAAVELGIAAAWIDAMANIPENQLARPVGILGAVATGYAALRSAQAGSRNAGIAVTGNHPTKK